MGSNTEFILTRKWHVLVLIITLGTILSLGAYFYFSYEAKTIRTETHNELKTIAELKTSQIIDWNNERLADIKIFSQGYFFKKSLEKWLASRTNKSYKENILNILSLFNSDSIYENVTLADTHGNFIISSDTAICQLDSTTSDIVQEAVRKKDIVNTGLYRCNSHNKIHLDYIAPILNEHSLVLGVMIFRVNPNNYLYPLIKEWPAPSKTSETLIVRKEGNRVLYLNELNHQRNTALRFSLPLTRTEIPSVQAALGFRGIFEGVSYHGTKVLSFITPIAGTPWIMVAQMDESEIYSGLYFKEIAIILFTTLLILSLSLGLIWIYHYRQRNIFRELFNKEKELREYHEEFRTILYSIGDGVITTDTNGFIKQMNHTAELLTGWSEEESKDKPVDEVFNIKNEITGIRVDSPVRRVLKEGGIIGLANHTLLITRDGNEFPIADSGAPIRNELGEIEGVVLVFRDKTEEYHAEKLIRQSEARLKRAELASKSGNWELHLTSRKIIASEGAEKIYGVNKNEMDYEVIKEFPLPEYRALMDTALKELIDNAKPYDIEFKIKTANEKEIKDIHSIAEYDKENNVLFGVIQDITEQKRTEVILRESEERWQFALEGPGDGVWDWNLQTNFVYYSHQWKAMLGYDDHEIGDTLEEWENLVHPEDKPFVLKEINRHFAGETSSYKSEHRIKCKDGSFKWILDRGKIMGRTEDGRPLRIIGTHTDITDRKQAEKALRESEENLRTTLYSIGDGVIATDARGFIKQMNPIAECLTGWKETESKNKPLEEIFRIINEDTRNTVENPVNKVLKEGKIVGMANHTLLISKDGLEIPIADSGAPIRNEQDEIVGVVLVFRDQLKERAAQKALEESEAQLKLSQKVAGVGYYILDIHNGTWTSSEMLDEIFGIDKNYKRDLEGWFNLIQSQHRKEMAEYYSNHVIKEKREFNKEYKIIRHNDGLEFWVHGLGNLEFDNDGNPAKMFGTIQDITESKQIQNIIENSLKEKEILLKEIHHRVKNNFQRIISLIVLQTELIEDEKILSIFDDLKNRLYSMSLIHELMYGTGDFVRVDIKDYIQRLTGFLLRTYSSSNRIKLHMELEEHSLDLDTIIPCGLIINEAITNSLKYAFPDNDEGEIRISFKKINDEFNLSLSDNGIGINNSIDLENLSSLGMRLVNLLTRQIRGTLELNPIDQGFSLTIKFKGEN